MADDLAPFNRSLLDQRAVLRNSAKAPPRSAPVSGSGAVDGRDPEKLLRIILIIIIAILGLVVVLELGFQLLVAPQMRIQRITIDSDLALTRDAVLAAAGISADELYYAIDPVAVETRLQSIPAVQEVKVSTLFPDGLSIVLRSRKPLVVSLMHQEDGRQMPVLIDAMGVAFHVGLLPLQDDLPVLTGIEFRNFRLGLQLPRSVIPLLQDLQNLRLKDPNLFHAFSQFRLMPVGTGQVEVMAYTVTSTVGVRINAHLSQEAALYILRTLDLMMRTEGMSRIREIDFRTNSVVYKKGDN
jgi:cell division protein FtsQ